MKRVLAAALAVLLITGTMSACGSSKEETSSLPKSMLPSTAAPGAAATAAPVYEPEATEEPEPGPVADSLGILVYTVPDWDYEKDETDEKTDEGYRLRTATYSLNKKDCMVHIELLETEKYRTYTPERYADMILTANVESLGSGDVMGILGEINVYCGVPTEDGDDGMQYVAGYFRTGDNAVVMVEAGLATKDIEEVWDIFEDVLYSIEIND